MVVSYVHSDAGDVISSGKIVFADEGNQRFEMRSAWIIAVIAGGPRSHNKCPYEREKEKTQRRPREGWQAGETRLGSSKSREGLSHYPPGGTAPPTPRFHTSGLQNCERINLFYASWLGNFHVARGTNTDAKGMGQLNAACGFGLDPGPGKNNYGQY